MPEPFRAEVSHFGKRDIASTHFAQLAFLNFARPLSPMHDAPVSSFSWPGAMQFLGTNCRLTA